jgi:outer membrane receptor protein involved in Fe transport
MKGQLGLAIAFAGVLWVSTANAQVATGTISGTVRDNTGAVLPGVTVVVQNQDTGISRTVLTNEAGYYSAPSLGVGQYGLMLSLPGFQTVERTGITLTVGREAVVDVQLSVGAIAQTLEVTEEAPLVATTNASVSFTVGDTTIRELPLNGRDLTELVLLNPGVNDAMVHSNADKYGYGRRISISGARGEDNSFLLDGSYIGNFRRQPPSGPGGALFGAETVREFEVVTNSYSAQYGRVLGGVFNAVSKSGDNGWHGGIYEFLRNSSLDARNFFDQRQKPDDPRLPPFRRNQFGATFSGPIVRNKAFFFANYEGLRESLTTTQFTVVPDLNARKGILPGGRTVQVNPIMGRYLQYIAEPSPGGINFGDGTAQRIWTGKRIDDDDFGQARLDYQMAANDSFFARLTASDSLRRNDASPNSKEYALYDSVTTRLLTLSETHIFSPRLLNTFQFSANGVRPEDFATTPKIPDDLLSVPGGNPPTLGYGFGLDSGTSHYITNRFNVQNDITWTLTNHSLRFGGMLERLQSNITNVNRPQGAWTFANVEQWLLANPRQYRGTPPGYGNPSFGYRQWLFGLYTQDDWRIAKPLTLNIGLRWEPYTVPTEVNGRMASLRNITDPALTVGPPWLNHSWGDLEPRLGFAWRTTDSGKTSVRGGVGLFRTPLDSNVYWSAMSRTWPYQPEFQFALTANDAKFFPLAVPLIASKLAGANLGVGAAWDYQNMRSPRVWQYNLNIQQQIGDSSVVSLGYTGHRGDRETSLGDYNVPTAVFNGSSYEFPATAKKLNSNFEGINLSKTNARSWYNALLLSFQKRLSAGLQMQVSYTYSKVIDQSDSDIKASEVGAGGGTLKYVYDLNAQRALSAYDIRNVLSINYTYDIPSARRLKGPAGSVLSGWRLSGIVKMQDGQPFSVNRTASSFLSGLSGSPGLISPNLVPGFTAGQITWGNPNRSKDPTGLGRYFNPAAYSLPGVRDLGNVGRNTLIGPGVAMWNAALSKNMAVSEGKNLEFRGEFFNVLNRANFAAPSPSVFDASGARLGNAGVIQSTNTTSRQIQFGLKLSF